MSSADRIYTNDKYEHHTEPDYILFSYPASISIYLMQIEELIVIDHEDILIMDSKNELFIEGKTILCIHQEKTNRP